MRGNNMNKKIYLIIIWTITLLLILFVCLGKPSKIHFHINPLDNNEWNNSKTKDNTKYANEIDEELSKFSNIDISSNVMQITIKQGSSYHITASYNKTKYMPDFKIHGDTLMIEQNIPKHSAKNINCNLEITVPANAELNKVTIHNNIGEIELKDFNSEDVRVKNNVGELYIKNLNFNSLETETNVGEISINTEGSISNYDISAKTDIGEIQIEGKNYKHSFKQSSNSGKKITAITNVGEVSIN